MKRLFAIFFVISSVVSADGVCKPVVLKKDLNTQSRRFVKDFYNNKKTALKFMLGSVGLSLVNQWVVRDLSKTKQLPIALAVTIPAYIGCNIYSGYKLSYAQILTAYSLIDDIKDEELANDKLIGNKYDVKSKEFVKTFWANKKAALYAYFTSIGLGSAAALVWVNHITKTASSLECMTLEQREKLNIISPAGAVLGIAALGSLVYGGYKLGYAQILSGRKLAKELDAEDAELEEKLKHELVVTA